MFALTGTTVRIWATAVAVFALAAPARAQFTRANGSGGNRSATAGVTVRVV
jgi:hypothetical protein